MTEESERENDATMSPTVRELLRLVADSDGGARMDAETDCLRLACARVPSQMVSIGVARCSLRLLKSLLVGVFARLARGSDSRGLDSSIADRGAVTGDSSPAA